MTVGGAWRTMPRCIRLGRWMYPLPMAEPTTVRTMTACGIVRALRRSAGPDQRSGYHHRANGPVVSKRALDREKGVGSGFPKPIGLSVRFRKTIEVVLQRLQVHIVRLRHRFL